MQPVLILMPRLTSALRSPALTAEWEQQLKEVEEGQRPAGAFYRNIVGFLRELIPQVAQGPALSPEQVAAARARHPGRKGKGRKGGGAKPAGLGCCPLCRAGEIVETAKAYGCSRYRDGCQLTIWKTVAGRTLTKQQVGQLLHEGRTERIEGFTSKAGKPFAARLKLGEGFKVEFDFGDEPRRVDISGSAAALGRAGATTASPAAAPRSEPQPIPQPLVCPKCSQGRIIEGRRGFGCSRYREGCDFVVWKEISGKRLTEKQIHALIGKRKTPLIRGFKGPSGGKFNARLRLDSQCKVELEGAESSSLGNEET